MENFTLNRKYYFLMFASLIPFIVGCENRNEGCENYIIENDSIIEIARPIEIDTLVHYRKNYFYDSTHNYHIDLYINNDTLKDYCFNYAYEFNYDYWEIYHFWMGINGYQENKVLALLRDVLNSFETIDDNLTFNESEFGNFVRFTGDNSWPTGNSISYALKFKIDNEYHFGYLTVFFIIDNKLSIQNIKYSSCPKSGIEIE